VENKTSSGTPETPPKVPVSEESSKRKKGKKLVFGPKNDAHGFVNKSVEIHKGVIRRRKFDKPDVVTVKSKGKMPTEKVEVETEDVQIKGFHIELKKHKLHIIQLKEEVR